jgi:hypothetical protein
MTHTYTVHAPPEQWRGYFINTVTKTWHPFDRAYTKSEWSNWYQYLTALGASDEEARATLLKDRLPGPKAVAEGLVGPASAEGLLRLLG